MASASPLSNGRELLLVNLPSLNHIATCLLAELHKRKGYFLSILRLCPIVGNSQAVCDGLRAQR